MQFESADNVLIFLKELDSDFIAKVGEQRINI